MSCKSVLELENRLIVLKKDLHEWEAKLNIAREEQTSK
jgi:hypothetical protein